MTDNEIIKALKELECYSGLQQKYTIAIHNVLYLINRQNAEIERLTKTISDREYSCGELTAALQIANELLKTEKSEAIKEFSERLKESIYTHENRVDVDGIILLTRIDNSIDILAKEMTGVKENEM